jgi:hypothetical protein
VGKSAYEVAVDAGFLGTVDQWLASLQSGSAGQIALKTAAETANILVDFADLLEPGEVCMSVMSVSPASAGLILGEASLDGTVLSFAAAGGTPGANYRIDVAVQTTLSQRRGSIHIAISV